MATRALPAEGMTGRMPTSQATCTRLQIQISRAENERPAKQTIISLIPQQRLPCHVINHDDKPVVKSCLGLGMRLEKGNSGDPKAPGADDGAVLDPAWHPESV